MIICWDIIIDKYHNKRLNDQYSICFPLGNENSFVEQKDVSERLGTAHAKLVLKTEPHRNHKTNR